MLNCHEIDLLNNVYYIRFASLLHLHEDEDLAKIREGNELWSVYQDCDQSLLITWP